jgi:hypothetical protein
MPYNKGHFWLYSLNNITLFQNWKCLVGKDSKIDKRCDRLTPEGIHYLERLEEAIKRRQGMKNFSKFPLAQYRPEMLLIIHTTYQPRSC